MYINKTKGTNQYLMKPARIIDIISNYSDPAG